MIVSDGDVVCFRYSWALKSLWYDNSAAVTIVREKTSSCKFLSASPNAFHKNFITVISSESKLSKRSVGISVDGVFFRFGVYISKPEASCHERHRLGILSSFTCLPSQKIGERNEIDRILFFLQVNICYDPGFGTRGRRNDEGVIYPRTTLKQQAPASYPFLGQLWSSGLRHGLNIAFVFTLVSYFQKGRSIILWDVFGFSQRISMKFLLEIDTICFNRYAGIAKCSWLCN